MKTQVARCSFLNMTNCFGQDGFCFFYRMISVDLIRLPATKFRDEASTVGPLHEPICLASAPYRRNDMAAGRRPT